MTIERFKKIENILIDINNGFNVDSQIDVIKNLIEESEREIVSQIFNKGN